MVATQARYEHTSVDADVASEALAGWVLSQCQRNLLEPTVLERIQLEVHSAMYPHAPCRRRGPEARARAIVQPCWVPRVARWRRWRTGRPWTVGCRARGRRRAAGAADAFTCCPACMNPFGRSTSTKGSSDEAQGQREA